MVILAQICAMLAIFVYSLGPHQKDKKGVLICNLTSNVLYLVQYLLLGAFTAVGINIIDFFQSLVFYRYAKEEKDIPLMWWIGYVIILITIGIFTFTNIFSIFPILLGIMVAYGIWQNNLKVYRIIMAINILGWLIYNVSVQAYVGACGNIFQLVSAIIAMYRFKDFKFLRKKYITL